MSEKKNIIRTHETNVGSRWRIRPGLCKFILTISLFTSTIYLWTSAAVVMAGSGPKINEEKAAFIKAAYLRYISEFAIWPPQTFEDEESPIMACIMGEDPYGIVNIFKKMARKKGQSVQGRPVVINRLTSPSLRKSKPTLREKNDYTGDFKRELQKCHLLFLTNSEKERWAWSSQDFHNLPIIMVSEIEGFSITGGMIEFVVSDRGTIDLHINLKATQRAGLRLSSKLLRIKKGVKIVKYPDDNG